jgi:hypothetical protein
MREESSKSASAKDCETEIGKRPDQSKDYHSGCDAHRFIGFQSETDRTQYDCQPSLESGPGSKLGPFSFGRLFTLYCRSVRHWV